MSCRKCKTPKWRGAPCLNPDCVVNTQSRIVLRGRTMPMGVMVKHGFHAPNQTAIDSGYDAPIHNNTWQGAR
jgi:hypothetical protein